MKAGRIIGHRPWHVKRNKRTKLCIATWNVTTLLKPGKLQELTEQISETKLDIVAVQETRWSGNGFIKKNNFLFYYGGPKTRTGQAGTGFLIRHSILRNVINFETHNERISKMRLKGKYNNITLVNAYAPTEDKTDEIKEKFYEDLQYVINSIPQSDTIIILGDFNAKLGKEIVYSSVTGQFTLHEETSGNGELLCQFAIGNNLTIMSTQFQHKQIHKGTWVSPDNTINQIDHVIVSSNKKEIVQDVRTMRGPNIDSNHYMVKVLINQKLPTIFRQKRNTQVKRWNRLNLQNPFKMRQYRSMLHNNLKEMKTQNNNIDNVWENIKIAISTCGF